MNPSLHSHTHCQVAPADTQTKTWQRVCLQYRTEEKRNNEGTTMCIIHKGFSGMRSIVSRFNFGNGGYERSPQSLTKSYTKVI